MTVDIHQHVWPEPFLAALRARRSPPRLDGWTLYLPGEPPYAVDPTDHDPDARAQLARADGDDVVCVAPSAALGLDRLPRDEAAELAEAWLDGALSLPRPFRAWAMAGVREPDANALRAALERGAIGLELAADVLAAPDGLDRLAPLLTVLEEEDAALLVHPGPAGGEMSLGRRLGGEAGSLEPRIEEGDERPVWWAPVVPYVAQLHAAWWAWAAEGRDQHPRLRVCFVALAGLGPLHDERRRARGGERIPVDPLTFVETSTYGTQAVDAVVRVLGIDVVCHGSDRPYADPPQPALGEAALNAIRTTNPGRLLARCLEEVPA
jgi:6-methylsalicylate decarboxylase